MELQVADSLKIIQSIINQRKQKYEENGFFLIFWSVLIMLAGIIQFVMLIADLALLRNQLPDDFILQSFVKLPPVLAKQAVFKQRRARCIDRDRKSVV